MRTKTMGKLGWWWYLHNPFKTFAVWLYKRELKKQGYEIATSTVSTNTTPSGK